MKKSLDKYICLGIGDAPKLYFVCVDGIVYNMYEEQFVAAYPDFRWRFKQRASVSFPTRNTTPRALLELLNALPPHASANIPTLFLEAMRVAAAYESMPQEIIRVRIGCSAYYAVRTAGYIIVLNEMSFTSRKYDVTYASMRSAKYDYLDELDKDLKRLFTLDTAIARFSDEDFKLFQRCWDYLKGETMPKTASPFIAYKALMLFDNGTDLNKYDRDVFIWNSVEGVKRINFRQYLDLVEAPHSGAYKLAKVCRTELSEFDESHYDTIKGLATPVNGDKRGTIYMCFRALWYVATKEMMPAQC